MKTFPKYSIIILSNNKKGETKTMKKYVCSICGWEYDESTGAPDHGIAPNTKFEDLPQDFTCPLCGVGKSDFEEA